MRPAVTGISYKTPMKITFPCLTYENQWDFHAMPMTSPLWGINPEKTNGIFIGKKNWQEYRKRTYW